MRASAVTRLVSPLRTAAMLGTAFALVSWSLALSSSAQTVPSRIDLSRYQLTFDEPFNTLDVSAWGPGSRWIAHTPWNGDFGNAQFLDPSHDGPFRTKNGLLSITMSRRNGKWTSGLLSSADRQSHGFVQSGGYFEISAKMPGGDGVWPAFWLGSNAPDSEIKPEIDVLEYYGHARSAYMATVHLWRTGNSEFGDAVKIPVPFGSLESGFHRYGVSIEQDGVVFYFDRNEVARLPPKPEYLQPVYVMVDLAAGGGWPIDNMKDPSIMLVDYIRAYKLRDPARPKTTPAT